MQYRPTAAIIVRYPIPITWMQWRCWTEHIWH